MLSISPSYQYIIGAIFTAGIAFVSFNYLKLKQTEKIVFPVDEVRQYAQRVLGKKADDKYPLLGLSVLITGSTSGLGKEIAGELYELGAHVIVASRNKQKCELVKNEIMTEHPSTKGTIEVGVVDTSDLDSVKRFAKEFLATHDKLHYLINNAGIHYLGSGGPGSLKLLGKHTEDHISKQGYDMAFATNYMGHFLLTRYLSDLIVKSATDLSSSSPAGASTSPKFYGRILNIASAYHIQSTGTMLRPSLSSAMPEAARSDMQSFRHKYFCYGNNKLAQILHAKELQRRYNAKGGAGEHIRALSACPGWTRTPIIPKNAVGFFVSANAFPANAAALGAVMALLDPSLHGGEFVTNYVDPMNSVSGIRTLIRVATKFGPMARAIVVDLLAMMMLMSQAFSFGYHVDKPSDESMDPELAAALYDWTDRELTTKGY